MFLLFHLLFTTLIYTNHLFVILVFLLLLLLATPVVSSSLLSLMLLKNIQKNLLFYLLYISLKCSLNMCVFRLVAVKYFCCYCCCLTSLVILSLTPFLLQLLLLLLLVLHIHCCQFIYKLLLNNLQLVYVDRQQRACTSSPPTIEVLQQIN